MKKLYQIIILIIICMSLKAQNDLDSLYKVLNGEWKWYESYYLGDTYASPDNLSRKTIFSLITNSDSILFSTCKNDTLISTGKTNLFDISLPYCLISSDVVFGGDDFNGDFYSYHGVTFVNDTIIWFTIGDGKSAPVYRYKKKESTTSISKQYGNTLPNIQNLFYNHKNIILTINKLNTSINLIFKLINIQGIIVHQQRLNNNENTTIININNIPSGIYLGLLYTDNYLIDKQKIMISGE